MDITQKFRNVVRAIVGLPEDPGQPPQLDRLAWYKAQVIACASDGSTCDVLPDDPRIPQENGAKMLVCIPSLVVVVQPGAVVMLGWERGDPARPRVMPIFESGGKAVSVTYTDSAGDSISISGGTVTIKAAGTQVIQATATSLKLGLLGTLAVLVQGAFDSYGVPVTQAPAAAATIVKAG